MPKRISWKKGMRLTDEVLMAADACTYDHISKALLLAAGGRFGLLPSPRPFLLQLSITKGFVDVEALDCLAITRGGYLIDARFDTKFTNTFDGRVQIPDHGDEREFLLTINIATEAWSDTADGYCEPRYSFALIGANSAVPDNAMPIGRIINEDGWREDNTKFVPPCLYLSSHSKFEELHAQFINMMRTLDDATRQQLDTGARTAISIYWPVVQQMLITANAEHELMTPQSLLACVQKVVGAFTLACEFDEAITLSEADTFNNFARVPYSYRNAYLRIKQGLGMCYAISEKVERFSLLKKQEPTPPPPPPPAPEPVRVEPPKPDPRRIWDGKRI
ncbi:MAG: hypothetical protein IJ243_07110 [Prevotella sp.]|nr:hypothetical protein [Prevotella sp.]